MRNFIFIATLLALTGCAVNVTPLETAVPVQPQSIDKLAEIQDPQESDTEVTVIQFTDDSATISGRDFTGSVAPCNLAGENLALATNTTNYNQVLANVAMLQSLGKCGQEPAAATALAQLDISVAPNGEPVITETLLNEGG